MKTSANHPNYRPAKITCACGAVHETFSTRGDFSVEICAADHPFYTGKQRLLDPTGRVERFARQYAKG
jgi:large subunit ribosomal protein L31